MEVLIYFIVLFVLAIGFAFSGLNKLRKINEDSFIKKAKFQYGIKSGDSLKKEEFTRFIMIVNLVTALIFVIMIFVTYLVVDVKGYSALSSDELHFITTMSNLIALIYVLRIITISLMVEKFIIRFKEIINHLRIGYVVLASIFTLALVYNMIIYFTVHY